MKEYVWVDIGNLWDIKATTEEFVLEWIVNGNSENKFRYIPKDILASYTDQMASIERMKQVIVGCRKPKLALDVS